MKELLDVWEIKLSDVEFSGKLAGKSWQHEQALQRLKQVRLVIFLMAGVVFYPLLMLYFFQQFFYVEVWVERLVFCAIYLACGIAFMRYRLAALIIAILMTAVLVLIYFQYNFAYFSFRKFTFNFSVFIIIGLGIYFHFKEIQLKKELLAAVRAKHPEAKVK